MGAIDVACGRQFPERLWFGERACSDACSTGSGGQLRGADDTRDEPDDTATSAICCRHRAGGWRCAAAREAAGARVGAKFGARFGPGDGAEYEYERNGVEYQYKRSGDSERRNGEPCK